MSKIGKLIAAGRGIMDDRFTRKWATIFVAYVVAWTIFAFLSFPRQPSVITSDWLPWPHGPAVTGKSMIELDYGDFKNAAASGKFSTSPRVVMKVNTWQGSSKLLVQAGKKQNGEDVIIQAHMPVSLGLENFYYEVSDIRITDPALAYEVVGSPFYPRYGGILLTSALFAILLAEILFSDWRKAAKEGIERYAA